MACGRGFGRGRGRFFGSGLTDEETKDLLERQKQILEERLKSVEEELENI
jgi:hypothetical protein